LARFINRLTALQVERLKSSRAKVGFYADGGGLYLAVTGRAARSWVYRYMLNGKPLVMGLGSLTVLNLADVRAKAAIVRAQRQGGIDPIKARDAAVALTKLADAKALTFAACAKSHIDAHRPGWRNPKHVAQWQSTLATYAKPVIGKLSVQDIDTGLVLKIIEPIWSGKGAKPETATRLRGRIESVLDWAKARGYRSGENPARWRGHLDQLLPPLFKMRRVKHHAALPYADMAEFMASLHGQEGTAARALEFTILTGARTGEVIGAQRPEINASAKIWMVPAERMKDGKEHRIPLSARAQAIADAAPPEGFLFPGARKGRPLSNMAMLALLHRMGREDLTVHGFRSTFRDWAAERTNYTREVAEMALAHAVGDKVEAAYRRDDLFEKRRGLMNEWAKYCFAVAVPSRERVVALREKR